MQPLASHLLIIIFNSDKVNLNNYLSWSDIGSTKSPDSFSLGIDKAVCIVGLMAATQVGAIEGTNGLSGIIVLYLKVLTAV